MISMLRNELYKIFHSKRLYIFLSILLVFSVALAILINSITASGQMSEDMLEKLKGAYFPTQILSIIADLLLPIFATLFITFLVSDEYDNGTLKLPLLHGFTRGWLILSKIIATTLVTILMLLFVYIITYATGILFWGNKVFDNTMVINTFKSYSLTILPLITLIILTTFFAMLVKNSGVVIGVMVALFVLGSLVSQLFPSASTYLPIYYLKAFSSNLDKIVYSKAILVCIIYGFIFYAATYLSFFKMEIQK